MRKLILVMAVMFIAVSSYGQGISFDHSSWSELMAKAKAENKIVFVDFHTEWCGPCKNMAATTFMDAKVGEVFNNRFINAKIDAEKGEGIELAKKYEVKAYPTMLFIDAEGQVVHRIVGGKNTDAFMDELKKLDVFMKEGSLQQLDDKYKSGKRDLDFMKKYYALCDDSQKSDVLIAYLMAMPDSVLFNVDNKLLEEVSKFDKALHTRWIDGLVRMNSDDEAFNFSVTFPIQYNFSKLLQVAVDNGDEKLMKEILVLKDKAVTLNCAEDQDIELQWGRGLFFVSNDLISMIYNFANSSDVEAKKAQIKTYMTKLMETCKAQDPIAYRDTLVNKYGGYLGFLLKNANEQTPDIAEHINNWTDFYWRKSPNDKATKELCATWAMYLYEHQCFNAKGAMIASELLLRLGKKKEALKVLETAIEVNSIPEKLVQAEAGAGKISKPCAALIERLEEVKNDKF